MSSGSQNKFSPKQWIALAAAILSVAVCISLITYTPKTSIKNETFTTVLNTQKENTLIHLPDGSTAVLNTGSKLNFSSSFNQAAKREVYLEGEAFFDISHNPSKPFIVHTGSLETTVLGTAFNVKALPVDSQITVIVTRGKVKVSSGEKLLGMITKGQEVVYHKRNNNCTQKTVAEDLTLSWKKQDVLLDDVTVEDAVKLLEERFNITISFADTAIKNNRFTTVMQKNEGVEEVIKSICEFNAAQYHFNKKTSTIIISKNSQTTNLN